MNFLFLFVAVLVANKVNSAPCQSPPTFLPTCSPKPPIETGVIGAVGFDLVGNLSNDLWINGDDLTARKDPISKVLGSGLKVVGDTGLLVGDDIVGGLAGDTVVCLADGVKKLGHRLKNAGRLGQLLSGVLIPASGIVEKLGGDKL